MDPASAFSLACGVIQVIQVACKLSSGAFELYRKGSWEGNKEIEEQALNLQGLQSLVKSSSQGTASRASGHPSSEKDQELILIAQKCDQAAEKLLVELSKLKMDSSQSVIKAFGKSVKARYRLSVIEDLQGQMKKYQAILDTRILVDLRGRMSQIHLEQSEGFQKMNDSMRAMAIAFKSGQDSLVDQLRDVSLNQTKQILQRIDNTQQKQEDRLQREKEEGLRKEFRASLLFPEIFARGDNIADHHKETFQWIFDRPGADENPWDNFVEWLETGTGTYWINGKAGSGKSTLMRFICEDSRTDEALTVWAGGKDILRPAFYFWAAGSKLQQSVEGFLRSIIWQLLDGREHLIPSLYRFQRASGLGLGGTSLTWAKKSLLQCLESLVSQLSASFYICLFADGLDELERPYSALVELIKGFTYIPNFKCCFSSRPDSEFEFDFQSSSRLRLQDLTREDIKVYVDSKLNDFDQLRDLPEGDQHIRQKCAKVIVERANGVFVWVELAVQGQILGLKKGDSPELLLQRLENLPEAVENIYRSMLGKIEREYKSEAAWYLSMVLHRAKKYLGIIGNLQPPSIYACAIAKFGLKENLHLSGKLTASNVIDRCALVNSRILATCGGLLDVIKSGPKDGYYWVDFGSLDFDSFSHWLAWEPRDKILSYKGTDWSGRIAQFHHRTAKDFFENTQEGRSFLDGHSRFSRHPGLLDAAICLACMKICQTNVSENEMQRLLLHFMSCARMAGSDPSGISAFSAELMEYFDCQLLEIYRHRYSLPKDAHWLQYAWPSLEMTLNDRSDMPKEHEPSDMLTFAALTGNLWFVREKLHWITFDSSKINQLACCIVNHIKKRYSSSPDKTFGFKWFILNWDEVDMITELLRLGADPNAGAPTSIWQAVLEFLYNDVCGSFPSGRGVEQDDQWCIQTIDSFLEAGAHKDQRFVVRLGEAEDLTVEVGCGFHRVPLIGQNNEENWADSYREWTNETQDTKAPEKDAVRIRFKSSSNSVERETWMYVYNPSWCSLWSVHGRYISPWQSKEINRRLRVIIDAANDKENYEQIWVLIQWCQKTFSDDCDMCQACLSFCGVSKFDKKNLKAHKKWYDYVDTLEEFEIPDSAYVLW